MTVNSNGKVTIHGIGTTSIQIVATSTEKYNKSIKEVTITVNSKATKIKKIIRTVKNTATINWNKVDGYIIRYSTNSNFSNAETKIIENAQTLSTNLNNLNNKKYYIKILTYKKINDKYYKSK